MTPTLGTDIKVPTTYRPGTREFLFNQFLHCGRMLMGNPRARIDRVCIGKPRALKSMSVPIWYVPTAGPKARWLFNRPGQLVRKHCNQEISRKELTETWFRHGKTLVERRIGSHIVFVVLSKYMRD